MNFIKQFPNNVSVLFSSVDDQNFQDYEKSNQVSAFVNPLSKEVRKLNCLGTACSVCPFDNIFRERTSCNDRATLILKKLTNKITKPKELHAVLP